MALNSNIPVFNANSRNTNNNIVSSNTNPINSLDEKNMFKTEHYEKKNPLAISNSNSKSITQNEKFKKRIEIQKVKSKFKLK